MVLAYATLIGITPIVLAFLAGFFGATIPIGWGAYIAWLIICLTAGAVITITRR